MSESETPYNLEHWEVWFKDNPDNEHEQWRLEGGLKDLAAADKVIEDLTAGGEDLNKRGRKLKATEIRVVRVVREEWIKAVIPYG